MPAFIRKILHIESGISLAQWIYDTLANNWPRLVALFIAGGGMTYLSTITEWARSIGPAGIGGIVISTVLLTNLLLSKAQDFRAQARERNALASASTRWAETVDSVNPLDANFQKKRIRITDLAHPLTNRITAKKFSECQLTGPANIVFVNGCNLIGVSFGNCDMILTKNNMYIYNVIPIFDCSIIGGEMLNATIYVHPDMLQQLKNTSGITFVNLTGDPELDNI